MSLGVVMVCYHTIDETIRCANQYAEMDSIEHVIIVNNDTKTDEKTRLKSIKNSKIDVFFCKDNLGYSRGNNIGIKILNKKYHVDYIVISNSDVTILEDTILRCVEVLEKYDSLGAVAPVMKNPDGKQYPLRWLELGYVRILLRIFVPESVIDQITSCFCRSNREVVLQSFLPGSFFVTKSRAILKCKGFDESVFLYREEEILGKRMRKNHYLEAIIKDVSFIHEHNYTSESVRYKHERNKMVLKSEKIYFKKYLHANCIGMVYVKIVGLVYSYSRAWGWRIKECFEDLQRKM